MAEASGRACLLLTDNISNGLWGSAGRTLGVSLHLCSCLNINYKASEADLDGGCGVSDVFEEIPYIHLETSFRAS